MPKSYLKVLPEVVASVTRPKSWKNCFKDSRAGLDHWLARLQKAGFKYWQPHHATPMSARQSHVWTLGAATWKPAKGNEPASFAMVTVDRDPDILPYHPRQMAVLPPTDWKRWFYDQASMVEPLRSLLGSFTVKTIRKGSETLL
jgi:putative SOS response-associated peptidase YedK